MQHLHHTVHCTHDYVFVGSNASVTAFYKTFSPFYLFQLFQICLKQVYLSLVFCGTLMKFVYSFGCFHNDKFGCTDQFTTTVEYTPSIMHWSAHVQIKGVQDQEKEGRNEISVTQTTETFFKLKSWQKILYRITLFRHGKTTMV